MASLYAKIRNKEQRQKLVDGLKHIVAQTKAGAACMVPKEFVDQLMKGEPDMIKVQGEPDATGAVQVYATSQGIAAVDKSDAAPAAAAPAAEAGPKPTFELESGFDVPPSKRGGIRESIYPFGTMELKQSFFVPKSESKPNPAKTLASVVAAANRKFLATYPQGHAKAGQPTGKDGRKFTVRARTVADGEKAEGARVYRIQ